MNNDLISREALLKAMEEERQYLIARGQTGAEHIIVHHCLPIIDNAPTVEQRPQGEWKLDDTEQFCYCSNCEDTYYPRPLDPNWYYCPHCGADMRGGAE